MATTTTTTTTHTKKYTSITSFLFTKKIFPKDIFLPKMGNSKSKRNGAKREKEMVNVVICVQSFQLLNPRSKIQRSAISINVGVSREKKQYGSRFRDFPFFFIYKSSRTGVSWVRLKMQYVHHVKNFRGVGRRMWEFWLIWTVWTITASWYVKLYHIRPQHKSHTHTK